jgi:NAD(P)-dependent dehydrogenase (short-subunit alcohol dehydrogenase family)
VGLEIGRVDHDGLLFGFLGGQTHQDLGEHALLAPALPAVVQGLVRTVLPGRITPSQAIAIDENNAAQHAPVVDAGLAMRLREEGLETRHLRLGQPEEVAHVTARFSSRESHPQALINGS